MKRIHVAEPQLLGNVRRYVLDCIDGNTISMGVYVTKFEETFARVLHVRHAVACMNGTAALHMALLALGVKPGDEVLVPTLTYVATANAVTYCGATPVLCDVEPGSWTIAPDEIERKRTLRTVGILPVHLYGHPARMFEINRIALSNGWWVLEDAAEALGATYADRQVGTLGRAGMFSFYANKIVTCGEGGMVTTNDNRLADQMRLLRGQGMSTTTRYYHPIVGYNYRMTNLQAAIGLGQLELLQAMQNRRQGLWDFYTRRCDDNDIEYQITKPGVRHGHWMFTILVPKGVNKSEVMQHLDDAGIETRPAFIPMHRMPMYTSSGDYPVADDVALRGINLPTHGGLTPEDVERVCATVVEAFEEASCRHH
jgi:perosamine synthetase